MTFISHIKKYDDKQWMIQSNEEHCLGVAILAEEFASEFGMGDIARATGLVHDKGKEQKTFQQHIMKESGYNPEVHVDGDYRHAYVGALMAKQMYKGVADIMAPQIAGHHRGLYDYDALDFEMRQPMPDDVIFEKTKVDISLDKLKGIKDIRHFHHIDRMLYSCLVDADYLDTEKFMNEDLFKMRGAKKSLNDLMPSLEIFLDNLKTSAKDTEVNRIRAQVQKQCVETSLLPKGVYSLTVPTGGGKTLSSLVWAMHHAITHGMRRIIIAIPYTSIIAQTAAILKSVFGDENVLEHHSNIDPDSIKNEYLKQQYKLASENWDYPIIVTTNVQLFESMFANRPSDCRKLHNIANSILILDEVQTLPTDFLQPIVDALKAYKDLFGVSVLLTTASQPVLSGLIEGCNPKSNFVGIDNITEIIPNGFMLHDRLRRVQLDIDNSGKTYDEVADMLRRHDRVLCIVNTRHDAKELYDRLPQEGVTLHLSRMMCPEHVRVIIQRVKDVLKDGRVKVVRVIATQLIEAGVDIDFPVVYRQEAGLDSVLQAAGRCNREGRLDICTTHVFSLSKERALPRGAMQDANNARLALDSRSDWFAPITMTNFFKQLYCRKESFDKRNMKGLLYKPKEICFETASKEFRLIDDEGISVIVNYGESLKFIEQLRKNGPSYLLMKQLTKYTVCVKRNDFKKLNEMGAVEEVIEGMFVVRDSSQYDNNVGLRTDNHWMEEILTI